MDLSKFDWKFTLFGTPVRVMATFWIICVFFSPFMSGHEGPWLFGLLGWSVATLISFLTHEFGHAFAMRAVYGGRPTIDLGIGRSASGVPVFGGVTTSYATSNDPLNCACTAASGPALEIAIVFLGIALMALLGLRFEGSLTFGIVPYLSLDPKSLAFLRSPALLFFVYYLIEGFVWIGLVWGILNLIPIFPFDGGQILLSLLSRAMGRRGTRLALGISIALAGGLGILSFKARAYFMAFFLIFSAYQNYRLLTSRGY